MSYYILHKNNKLVGISLTEPLLELSDIGISAEGIDEDIPDLNKVQFDEVNLVFKHPTQLSKLEFLNLFTMQERVVITNSTDPITSDIMKLFDAAEYIDLMDANTQQAVGYFAMAGIITQERMYQILGGS